LSTVVHESLHETHVRAQLSHKSRQDFSFPAECNTQKSPSHKSHVQNCKKSIFDPFHHLLGLAAVCM
jgi:hypothetical protein